MDRDINTRLKVVWICQVTHFDAQLQAEKTMDQWEGSKIDIGQWKSICPCPLCPQMVILFYLRTSISDLTIETMTEEQDLDDLLASKYSDGYV